MNRNIPARDRMNSSPVISPVLPSFSVNSPVGVAISCLVLSGIGICVVCILPSSSVSLIVALVSSCFSSGAFSVYSNVPICPL